MMAEQMAIGAITGITGMNSTALNPMIAELSKMDAKQMENTIKSLTPLVGMLSQLSK
jgi:hypothetical protein